MSAGAAEAVMPSLLSRRSVLVLVACFACAMLDGYDVQVIAYAIPEMARDWSVPLSTFGFVLSAGLVGLVGGALFLAPLADRHGRRIVVILAAIGAAVATFANAFVSVIEWLILCRVFVGLTIGIMTALVVAIAFEAAPVRHRALAVAVIGTGFSLGNMASGMIASVVIPRYGWQTLFFGASAFAVLVALLFISSRFDTPLAPSPERAERKGAIRTLVSKELRPLTLTMWLLHFGGVGAMYVLLSWLPSLLTRTGYTTSEAAFTTSLVNFGGLFGGLAAGYLLARFGLKYLIICYVITCSTIALLPFAFHTVLLPIMNVVIGVCMIGGYVSNNIVASAVYPVNVRASGVGWAQGIGRTGSVISPLLVSLALRMDAPNATILLIAAVFPFLSGIAALLLIRRLRLRAAQGAPEGSELA